MVWWVGSGSWWSDVSKIQTLSSQVEFMQTMVGLPAYYACIALEATGITHFTWILADLACRACGLNPARRSVEENNNQNGEKDKSMKDVVQNPVV